jgi:phosphonate transport system ATP-binding protein
MLRTEALVKRFGSIVAVDRVTMHIPAGQMVGIIGRSGAGKSALLRLINRLIEPTHGTIHYRDIPSSVLKGRQLRAWRACCAMILQQFNLVNRLDVLTNVLIGRLSYHWTLPTLMKCFSAVYRALILDCGAKPFRKRYALQSRDLGDHPQIVGDSPQPTQRSMPSGP